WEYCPTLKIHGTHNAAVKFYDGGYACACVPGLSLSAKVSTDVVLEENLMIAGAIRDQMVKTIKYVKPAAFDSATGLTAQVYQQLQEDFIPAPLVVLHAPIPMSWQGSGASCGKRCWLATWIAPTKRR